jgi:hypothetical protein
VRNPKGEEGVSTTLKYMTIRKTRKQMGHSHFLSKHLMAIRLSDPSYLLGTQAAFATAIIWKLAVLFFLTSKRWKEKTIKMSDQIKKLISKNCRKFMLTIA